MADIDYNALGQATDTSWGRSSTPKSASYSVKWSMLGPDRLEASYAAVVQFGTERQMIEMKRRYQKEAESVVSEALKSIKARYKDLSESALKTKEVAASDTIEVINFNVHSPLRQAYYRRKVIFELS